MGVYRVAKWGTVIRMPSRRRVGALVATASLGIVTLGAILGLTVFRRGPAVGPRQAPTEGQTAIGWAGGQLTTYGAQRAVPIGSVAKVMTAYLVLRHHPLAVGQDGPSITVDEAAENDFRSRSGSDQSLLPVRAGDRLTEWQALEALMVPSANNIADLLGTWDDGSTTAFVADMNATARQLGLRHTHYADASGYSPGTVSIAVDQTRLVEKAMAVPALAAAANLRQAELPRAGTVRNYNALLGTDGVIGLKTGSTEQAGGAFVFAARRDGRLVVGAVLGQRIGASTPASLARAFGVTKQLIETLAPG